MKNKKVLFIIIGLFITIACILAINVLFPATKTNKINVLLSKSSNLSSYFKNDNIVVVPDSELNSYEIEEIDKKTTEELNDNNDKKSEKNYEKTKYMYNINNEEIEIVGYKGSNLNLIIPSKIDGIAVTKLNLSNLNNINSIFIPDSVKNIEGNFIYDNLNKNNLISINIIVIISFVIYIIAIGTLSNKNLEENFYNSTTYIFSIIYITISSILCFNNRIINLSLTPFYVSYGILTLIYILIIISLRFYKNRLMNGER